MADVLQENWMKGVAITTTVLAVMTAIVSARSATCVSKIQIQTAVEGSQWSYYQAKSIKHNLAETQKRDFLVQLAGPANKEQKALLEKEIPALTSEIARYADEKQEIKASAEKAGKEKERAQRQNNQFVIAVALFQIAIMLSSVSALVKRPWVWYIGIAFGFPAIFFFVNGFFLFYMLPFVF